MLEVPFQSYLLGRLDDPFGLAHDTTYRVRRAFTDYDRVRHEVGEVWTLIGSSFLPYDDGLSLFVQTPDGRTWHIRMQHRPEEQRPVIDRFPDYLEPIGHAPTPRPP